MNTSIWLLAPTVLARLGACDCDSTGAELPAGVQAASHGERWIIRTAQRGWVEGIFRGVGSAVLRLDQVWPGRLGAEGKASPFGDGDCPMRVPSEIGDHQSAHRVCGGLSSSPAHGRRPIDVLWARSFEAFCSEGVDPQQRAGQALRHRSRALRLEPSPARGRSRQEGSSCSPSSAPPCRCAVSTPTARLPSRASEFGRARKTRRWRIGGGNGDERPSWQVLLSDRPPISRS